jgi:glycosyltransferase involved in cell wall biosynthesis
VALFIPVLSAGGAERVFLHLAGGFAEQGLDVDLVLVRREGPLLAQVPPRVRIVDLQSSRLLFSLRALVRYLREARPAVLLSAMEDINTVALCARRLARVDTRVVATVHNTISVEAQRAQSVKVRAAPLLARRFYPWADAVVAVSHGAARDLVKLGVTSDRLSVIYNPVVTPGLFEQASRPVEDPWFGPGAPPVVLSAGRLAPQKDFGTLIRAFERLRSQRAARLLILGEGGERPALERLVQELDLEEHVRLPGYVDNPFARMARAALFVLSSLHEGLPTALIEAMAVGTPVVSTDCRSGPAEILERGTYGALVGVGDVAGLADAMSRTLAAPTDGARLRRRANEFSLERSVAAYRELFDSLLGSAPSSKRHEAP